MDMWIYVAVCTDVGGAEGAEGHEGLKGMRG